MVRMDTPRHTPQPPAIVLIDHGSRRPEANAALEAVASMMRVAAPDRHVEIAHMELAQPDLAAAVAACVAAGARAVVVVPYFLGHGRHTSEDIPRLAREAAATHPDLAVTVAAPLGPDPRLAALALTRASEI